MNEPKPLDFQIQDSPGQIFPTTSWTRIISVRRSDTPEARKALEDLCRLYWNPLKAFVRRYGYSTHDAEDMTQEFLSRFVAREYFGRAEASKGRFRTFIQQALKNFLTSKRRSAQALKRGGNAEHVSMNDTAHDGSTAAASANLSESPEALYERQWAFAVLQQALTRLETAHNEAGNAHFETMKAHLWGDTGNTPLREQAAKLGVNENALRTSLHRMRRKFGALLREVVEETVEHESEVSDEVRYLMTILAKSNQI
jgi:RNA polymerase sigma factor (sigma-70 family)